MDCPSPECREGLKQEVADRFREEKSCITTKLSEKLKTKTLLIIIGICVPMSIAAGGWIYNGYGSAQDRQNDRLTKHTEYRAINQKQINDIKIDAAIIKKDIEAIKNQTYRNETIQIEMLKILKKIEPN